MSSPCSTPSNTSTTTTITCGPAPENEGRHLPEYWTDTLPTGWGVIRKPHSVIGNTVIHGHCIRQVELGANKLFIRRCETNPIVVIRGELVNGCSFPSKRENVEEITPVFRLFGAPGQRGAIEVTAETVLALKPGKYRLEISVPLIQVVAKAEKSEEEKWEDAEKGDLVWRYPDEDESVSAFIDLMEERLGEADADAGGDGAETRRQGCVAVVKVPRERVIRGMRF